MIYKVEEIMRDVRVCLDQNMTSEALLADGDSDTLALDEVVRSKIVEGVVRVESNAAARYLEAGHNLEDVVFWGDQESGWVLLPHDFMRLITFRMSDWERTVYKAITPDDARYALQRQRVKFPLPYYKGDEKTNIEERNWKHDDLFTKQHYYTLLFDKEEDMDLVGDTSLTSVQVEWIFVKTRMVKKYYFERIKGAWILEAINLRPVERNENEDFVEFFSHFAADSLFQSRRVQEPLAFVTSDPDDDFSILETSLDLNQWFAFKPALPTDRLSNINYGQRNDDNSPTKILALKGIGNGFSNILYFRRKAGEWQLYKFEDTSI